MGESGLVRLLWAGQQISMGLMKQMSAKRAGGSKCQALSRSVSPVLLGAIP